MAFSEIVRYLLFVVGFFALIKGADLLVEGASAIAQKFKIDVAFDIDTKEKWPFEDNEFDLVIASQVLEHIFHLDEACKEIKRISKSHILIGLPNDMRIDNRILGLFGKNPIGIKKYGHCKLFDIPLAKAWIKEKFADTDYECEKIIYFYTIIGQRFVPKFLKRFLANLYPNLFAGEVYFLLTKIKSAC